MAKRPDANSTDEIEITSSMREAGARELLGYFGGDDPALADGDLAVSVYLAMCHCRDKGRHQAPKRNLLNK